MVKTIFLTLLMLLCLVYNRKIKHEKHNQISYWAVSLIGIVVYILALVRIDTSISFYLTKFVEPIVLWIFGGSFE
ncbi:hypothetical protein QFZ72_002986 [Bacillus sp. V2I10]|nr:hypothetical protein [Bacillus sp. V2I10]